MVIVVVGLIHSCSPSREHIVIVVVVDIHSMLKQLRTTRVMPALPLLTSIHETRTFFFTCENTLLSLVSRSRDIFARKATSLAFWDYV